MAGQGNSDSYDELVDQFNLKRASSDAPSPIPQLRLWIQALTHVVSRLDRTHSSLIEAIVRMPWMTMDSTLVKSYTSFIEILVSARPEYLSIVLGRIAQSFTYRASVTKCMEILHTNHSLQSLAYKRSTPAYPRAPPPRSHDVSSTIVYTTFSAICSFLYQLSHQLFNPCSRKTFLIRGRVRQARSRISATCFVSRSTVLRLRTGSYPPS